MTTFSLAPSRSTPPGTPTAHRHGVRLRILLPGMLIAAAVIAGGLGYLNHNARQLSAYHGPHLHALFDLAHYAITARQRSKAIFLQKGSGSENFSAISDLYARSEWYALALLTGGENGAGKIVPLKDPAQRAQVQQLRKLLATLRFRSEQHHANPVPTGSGSDHRHDQVFTAFITLNQTLAERISTEMKGVL